MGDPQNGRFVVENRIKMDDIGVPPVLGTSIYQNIYCVL